MAAFPKPSREPSDSEDGPSYARCCGRRADHIHGTSTRAMPTSYLTLAQINIAVLTVMHGQQLGWVCLGSCGTDVTMNALVLFWVTDHVSGSAENTPGTQCPTGAPGAGPVSNQSLQVVDDVPIKSPVRFGVPESPFPERMSTTVSGKTRRTSEVVFSKGASKASNLLSRIGDAFKARDEDGDRRHQMSVQVRQTRRKIGFFLTFQ